ncbi:hypothetical protein L798_12164 [Zootermopsis nevadensis]|uniref:Uncharacterized protein n=1 Tax=Zootermopsis nevadensis TaxID=136037 RepID=A0A067QUX8_ZOONE|nr:hypothetical protein L798_12164 [Zootermopsis nevadensis]
MSTWFESGSGFSLVPSRRIPGQYLRTRQYHLLRNICLFAFLPWDFRTKILYASLVFYMCDKCPVNLILDLIAHNIGRGVQIVKPLRGCLVLCTSNSLFTSFVVFKHNVARRDRGQSWRVYNSTNSNIHSRKQARITIWPRMSKSYITTSRPYVLHVPQFADSCFANAANLRQLGNDRDNCEQGYVLWS